MNELSIEAHAKLNLVLDILHKRDDGYHEIEFVMQELAMHDIIRLKEAEAGISIKCNDLSIPCNESNLAWKATELLWEKLGEKKGIEIFIDKRIPMAGGLAGGSADGAAVLKGLNDLWEMNLSEKELVELAAKFGSDTCFCVLGKTCIAKGRGEILERTLSPPKLDLVIIDPEIPVPAKKTAWIYGNFNVQNVKVHPSVPKMIEAIKSKNKRKIAESIGNAFHYLTIPEYSRSWELIEELKEQGAMNASLAGSGPTCYAICENEKSAKKLAEKMKEKYEKVFVTKTV